MSDAHKVAEQFIKRWFCQDNEILWERGGRYKEEVVALTAALDQAKRDTWEEAVRIVEAEPELPGPMPEEMYSQLSRIGVEQVLRCLVKSTKEQIVADLRLRQQARDRPGGGE